MILYFLGIIGVLILMFAFAFLSKELNKKDKSPQKRKTSFDKILYRPRKFQTDSEIKYFRTLEKKYGADYYIIPQVLLSCLVDVDIPKDYFAYKGYRSKIDKKTIDFVLFDKVSFMPVLAVELDDYTHERPDRHGRDIFVNAVLEKVGIKIERVNNINDLSSSSLDR